MNIMCMRERLRERVWYSLSVSLSLIYIVDHKFIKLHVLTLYWQLRLNIFTLFKVVVQYMQSKYILPCFYINLLIFFSLFCSYMYIFCILFLFFLPHVCYFLIFFSSVNPTCIFQISTFSALLSFLCSYSTFSGFFFPIMFRSGREPAWSVARTGPPKSRTTERAFSEPSYLSPKLAQATTRSRWFGTRGENCATEQGMMGNMIYWCMILLQLVR